MKYAGGADDLYPGRVLSPSNGIANRTRLFWSGSIRENLGHFEELLFGNTADTFNHLWCVTREVPLKHIKDTERMLEHGIGIVLVNVACLAPPIFSVTSAGLSVSRMDGIWLFWRPFVEPGLRRIFFLFFIPAGENAIEVVRKLHVVAKNRSCVRVVLHVLAELFSVFEYVMNQSTKKDDVAAGTHRNPDIRHRRSASEARIDVDDGRTTLACLNHPLEADGMILRHRRSHNENGIGICQVLLCGGRTAASERGTQTGHRGAVSYTRLIAQADHAQTGGEQFLD